MVFYVYTKKELLFGLNSFCHAPQDEHRAELIIGYLQDFGLTEKEAEVYFVLSKLHSATAAEIASVTKFSRLQTYRSIKGLLDYGLVEMLLERPRKYTPLKIEQAINLLGQEAEQKIFELEKKAPVLIKEWNTMADFQINRMNYTFRIIQGTKNVFKFRIMLYESAKREIAVTVKANELAKLVLDGVDDVFEKVARKNVNIRGLSEVNQINANAFKRFLEFSKFQHINHSTFVPFAIIDEQETLICLSRDGKNSAPENAIWTNHPDMVGTLKEIFEILWKDAQDGRKRVKEVEQT